MKPLLVTFYVLFTTVAFAQMTPTIELSADTSFVSEPLGIAIHGLKTWANTTLLLECSISGWPFVSTTTFLADATGDIDVSHRAPLDGGYHGIDPFGPFWSMLPAERADTTNAAHLQESDKPGPWVLPPPRKYRLTIVVAQDTLVTKEFTRLLAQPVVHARAVDADGIQGALFLPAGTGPHPALLVLSGAEGGYPTSDALVLANLGYAAFAIGYFGAPGLSDQLSAIPLESFIKALDWMTTQPEIDASRLGVFGSSRGGELALLLGSYDPRLRVVVANAPSHVVWGGCCVEEVSNGPAWTHQGRPLPFIPENPVLEQVEPHLEPSLRYMATFWLALADQQATAAAAIPVERIRGGVLMFSGRDDKMWPSAYMAERVVARLREQAFPYPMLHVAFAEAGHLVGYGGPSAPMAPLVEGFDDPATGEHFEFGGQPAAMAAAAKEYLHILAEFLQTNLRGVTSFDRK